MIFERSVGSFDIIYLLFLPCGPLCLAIEVWVFTSMTYELVPTSMWLILFSACSNFGCQHVR